MPTINFITSFTYWVFAMIYTFKVWGIGWGLLSIILPIFPLIDLAKYLVSLVA